MKTCMTLISLIFLGASIVNASNLTKDELVVLVKTFEKHNSPRLESRHKVPLRFEILWDVHELSWGMAQYLDDQAGGAKVEIAAIEDSRLTSDGVLMGLCHELGHLIRDQSQPPKFHGQRELLADFFATSNCFIDFLSVYPNLTDANDRIPGDEPPQVLIKNCSEHFAQQSPLCLRALRASYSTAKFIGFARPQSSPASWDIKAERAEDFLQCSLESYVAGIYKSPMPGCFDKE